MRVNKLLIQTPLFFFLGALATFSLEPYKIYPLIFCFSFAIGIILSQLEGSKLMFLFNDCTHDFQDLVSQTTN